MAGMAHIIEPRSLINRKKARPADIATQEFLHHDDTWIDVGITQSQYPNTSMVNLNEKDQLKAGYGYEKSKITKFNKFVNNTNNLTKPNFFHFIIEIIGEFTTTTNETITSIARKIAQITGKKVDHLVQQYKIKITAKLYLSQSLEILDHYRIIC